MCNCSTRDYELIPELETMFNYGNELQFDISPRAKVTMGTPTIGGPVASSTVTPTPCNTTAVNVMPQHLEPKLMGCSNTVVPSKDILYLFQKTLQNNPGPVWLKMLNSPLDGFLAFYPNVNVTVELWRFITLPDLDMRELLAPFKKYLDLKGPKYRVSIVSHFAGQKTIEAITKTSMNGLVTAAGPLPNALYKYYWHVYATYPDDVKGMLRNPIFTNVDKFAFNKADVLPSQKQFINTIAVDIIESWYSPDRVTKVTIVGHTDKWGKEDYNMDLGKRRAEAVAKAIQQEILRVAPAYFDPSKLKIDYQVLSMGETQPVSKRSPVDNALNRRVEITLGYTTVPAAPTATLDDIIRRCMALVRRNKSMYPDQAQRLLCLLNMLQRSNIDDRILMGGQGVLDIQTVNKFPFVNQWNRLRLLLVNQIAFGPAVTDGTIIRRLVEIDELFFDAKTTILRITGAKGGATPKAVEQLMKWLVQQSKNPSSIYYCYKKVI